jgi:hypothetical protein
MGSVVDGTVGSVVDDAMGRAMDDTVGGVVDNTVGDVVDDTTGNVVDLTMGSVIDNVVGSVVDNTMLLPQFETQFELFQTLVQVGSSRQVTLDAALRVLLLALGPLSRGRVGRRWASPPWRWAGATMARRGRAVAE